MPSRPRSAIVSIVAATSIMGAVFATVASGEENTATKVSPTTSVAGSVQPAATTSASSGEEKTATKTFRVGDTVKLGDWTLKVNKFTDPVRSTNEFDAPPAGKRWIAVDATVGNHSGKQQTVSSMLCFDVRDSASRKYEITLGNMDAPQLDGDVAANDKLRGTLTFEVPKAAKGFSLHFNCDLFSSGAAVVKLS